MKLCGYPDCGRKHLARGYCASHYRLLRRTGAVRKLLADTSPSERFWASVDKTGDCWLWTKSVDGGGYGIFTPPHGVEKAHRFAYKDRVGPIPPGLHIDHLCHVRACVRPEHLQAVTQQENNESALRRIDNTSGFRGVSWHKPTGKWMSYGQYRGRNNYLGVYDTAEEAAAVSRNFRAKNYTNYREEPL